MERQVLLTGIGGQGVQLAVQVLARAVLRRPRRAAVRQLRGHDAWRQHRLLPGHRRRPGRVAADGGTLGLGQRCLCITSTQLPRFAGSATGGVVLVNTTVWECCGRVEPPCGGPASDLAVDAGNVIAAGMVMLGALCTATRVVDLDALRDAARSSCTSHATPRAQRACPGDGRRRAGWCRGRGLAHRVGVRRATPLQTDRRRVHRTGPTPSSPGGRW